MTARAHTYRLAAHVWDACPGQRAESQLSRNSPAGVVGRDQADPTAAKFGRQRQHQKLGPAPAARHWRSCKILQVPTHHGLEQDFADRHRRRCHPQAAADGRAGACTEYEASPEVEDRRSRGGAGCTVPPPPKGTYRGDRRWTDLGPSHCNGTERDRALYRFPSLGWCCVLTSHFRPGLCALPVASTPRQHHILEHERQSSGAKEAAFSIPDGQLTSALNAKLHFPQILSAKHPCHAARFPQSAPESFRSLDTTPGRTTPQSRARRLEHPCSQAPVPSHPHCPTSPARDGLSILLTRAWPIPDLTRGMLRPCCCQRDMYLSCVTNAPAGSHFRRILFCGTLSRGALASAVVSVVQPNPSRCASLQRRSCTTALTAF